jgi:hemolysin activation/secretion protein
VIQAQISEPPIATGQVNCSPADSKPRRSLRLPRRPSAAYGRFSGTGSLSPTVAVQPTGRIFLPLSMSKSCIKVAYMSPLIKQLTCSTLVCGTFGATTVLAVEVPSSGSLLQNNPILNAPVNPRSDSSTELPLGSGGQAAAAADAEQGESFHVARIEVEDVLPALQAAVEAAVAPYRDQQMTFGMLRNVAVKVTVTLQDAGERLSYAYIPNQDVVDGVVKLKVLRGFIESAKLGSNTSLVSERVLKRYLDNAVSLNGDVGMTESQLLRLSDLPGVGATKPVLAAGEQPGGSALTVDIAPGNRSQIVMVADNSGSKASGKWRVGTQVTVNSPLGIGDRLQAVAYAAPDFLQPNRDSQGGNTLVGRLSYDLPIGGSGLRGGLSYSKVRYALGGRIWRDTGDGFAEVYSLYGSYPLVRSATRNLNLSANLDFKRMNDTVLKEFNYPSNSRSATVLNAQLAGDRQGQVAGLPNALTYQFAMSGGDLNRGGKLSTKWWDPKGDAKGRYYKATQSLRLSQGLVNGVYLDLALSGQQASHNLDSSEKMTLGGPNGVRAYSNDAASVDSGWLLMPTLNVAVPKVNGLTAQLFYDYARGALSKFDPNRNVVVSMAGYGVGLSYTLPKLASINMSYGRRNGSDALLGPQARDQVWLNTAIRF